MRKEDKAMKKGGPTWKQLIQALRVIKEIHLSEEIFEKLMKQQKVLNPVKSTKEKSIRDLSTDEKSVGNRHLTLIVAILDTYCFNLI